MEINKKNVIVVLSKLNKLWQSSFKLKENKKMYNIEKTIHSFALW